MALIVPLIDTTRTAPFTMLSGDSMFVGAGIDLVSTSSSGLAQIGSGFVLRLNDGITFTVLGSMTATAGVTIDQVDHLSRDVSVFVGDEGSIGGLSGAIELDGCRYSIENHGQIFSAGVTIDLRTLSNIEDVSLGPQFAEIVNDGVIFGDKALLLIGDSTFSIRNSGTIQAATAIDISFGTSRDTVINSGQIIGTVNLGANDDRFDNRGGRIADSVDLGTGNDTYTAGGAGAEVVEGGAGTDVLDLRHLGAATLAVFSNAPNAGSVAGDTFTGFEVILGSNTGNDAIFGLPGHVRIDGNGGNDTLAGMEGFADTLNGGAGNDSLIGGQGDRLSGGSGNDIYEINNGSAVIVEAAGGGTDTVLTQASYVMANHLEHGRITVTTGLSLTGNSLNNQLTGNAGADTLNGGAGDDRLEGGAGANRLAGGTGNDLYVVGHSGSTIIEAAGAGTDTVHTAVSLTLAAHVENGQISTAAARSLTGNAEANALTGNAGADTLNGGAGNDRLDGAGGADLMLGGAGNDTYVVNTAADQLVEAANGGTDLVLTSASLTLAAEVENARVTATGGLAVTGNRAANRIEGGAGDDRLSGLSGRDQLLGGLGRDALSGGTGRDRLDGGAGDDRLTGGRGRDALTGGAGDDDFVFLSRAEGRDQITDFTQGQDQIVIRAAGFRGGLVAGDLEADLFVTGTANRAQDAEDRFIFRTTDATLWFDANGSARGGRVLVADLQDGAVLDAGDILLI